MHKPYRTGANWSFSIESADGEFVPIREIRSTKKRKAIICVPTPTRNGFEWMPDWYQLTHFG